jgi:hypothetical protein
VCSIAFTLIQEKKTAKNLFLLSKTYCDQLFCLYWVASRRLTVVPPICPWRLAAAPRSAAPGGWLLPLADGCCLSICCPWRLAAAPRSVAPGGWLLPFNLLPLAAGRCHSICPWRLAAATRSRSDWLIPDTQCRSAYINSTTTHLAPLTCVGSRIPAEGSEGFVGKFSCGRMNAVG